MDRDVVRDATSGGDADLLWPLVHNILAAQRGRPYPGLDDILRRDPTVGLPPDVRRALLTVAAAYDERVQAQELSTDVGKDRPFNRYDYWPELPPLEPDPHPERMENSPVTKRDVEAFFRQHHLQPPGNGEDDEHIAEREFITEVVVPVLGQEGLRRITPQEPFEDLGGRQRRIDFVLRGERPYALEVEGATYHAIQHLDERSFDDETRRRRSLSARGYAYHPFTYGEIRSGEALHAFRQLCEQDALLAPLISSGMRSAQAVVQSQADLISRKLLVWAPERFVQVQRALLPLLAGWVAEGKSSVAICNCDAQVGILNFALCELLTCANYTARLFNLQVTLPDVIVYTSMKPLTGTQTTVAVEVLQAYLGAETGDALEDHRTDQPGTGRVIHVFHEPDAVPAGGFDAVFAVESPAGLVPDLDSQNHTLTMMPAAPSVPCPVEEVVSRFAHHQPDRQTLDYFARRLFNIPQLKDEQVSIITRLLSGASQLAILPTAFGKSLCYQLPGILIPGVIFVVSPLRALMRDQMHGLEARGLTCAGAIAFDDNRLEKQRKMEWLRQGKFRIFYLAPERIQVRTFAREVLDSVAQLGAWALAVDEAHCASEWGHDFRVAYLQLGRFRNILSSGGRPVPALGLTATASPWVATDICSILEIADTDIIRHATIDRSEISLSVHAVPTLSEKPEMLRDLIQRAIPGALKRRSLLPSQKGTGGNAATVIFAPYANAHGSNTADQNCTAIMQSLVQSGTVGKEQIRTYSSTQPQVCPQEDCLSIDCIRRANETGEPGYLCRTCHTWSKNLKPLVGLQPTYDHHVRMTQEEYARSDFPVLVATKGYGMGIDKRNIRAIIHYSFSDGLEAYVQEMGRAGRDQRHAHAALVYGGPTPECAANLLSGSASDVEEQYQLFEPACISDATNYKYWKCPHGLSRLCDYGLKARSIQDRYASVEEEVERVLRVYKAIAAQLGNTPNGNAILRPREILTAMDEDGPTKPLQFALYRLQETGKVRDWFVDYEQDYKNPPVMVRVRHDWTLTTGIDQARRQLGKLVLSDREQAYAQIEDELNRLHTAVASSTEAIQIERLVALIVRETHRVIKAMRYNMLFYEWQYARAEEDRTCRRQILRRVFDDRVVADTSCGACDVCCPDLNFTAEHIVPAAPSDAEALADLSERLPEAFASFNGSLAEELVAIAKAHQGIVSLQGQAEQRLVSDPGNLSALAIAGLCARQRGLHDLAVLHFVSGFLSVETGTRDVAVARYFYERTREVDPARAIGLLDKRNGLFDTPEGHSYVVHELEQVVGQDIAEHSHLQMAQWLQLTDEWKDRITPSLHEALGAVGVARSASVQPDGNTGGEK